MVRQGALANGNTTHKLSEVTGFAEDESVRKMYRVGNDLLFETLAHNCYLTDSNLRIKAKTVLPVDGATMVVNNKIYMVNQNGYAALLDKTLQPVQENLFPQISSRITAMATCGDDILVGTFGQGLFMYGQRGGLVKHMDKTSGLYSNIVTSLLVDGNRLFLGSNVGLISADLPDLQHAKLFKESEGMFTWECRPDGLKKLSDGGLLIATTSGLYLYYPDKDKPVQYGQLTIASFDYGAHHAYFSPVSSTHQLSNELSYHDNNIAITLNGISQRNPDDIVYHYQLNGFDSVWRSTGNPVMAFNNLSPGGYCFNAYITVGGFRSRPLSILFSVAKPISGKLWFQALLVVIFSLLCWALLTVGNRIYQRYIQSKMLSRLEKEVNDKQQLTIDSVWQTGSQFAALHSIFDSTLFQEDEYKIIALLLQDVGRRLKILWGRESISVAEIHRYFDDLLAAYGSDSKTYHKEAAGRAMVSAISAFHLLQLFSLYAVVNLFQNKTTVFSLDSETKTASRLLLRFYTLKAPALPNKHSVQQFLKKAIEAQKPSGLAVDVIENFEHGNMLVAELTIQNENT